MIHNLKLSLSHTQSLVNMGEILKAAGCSFDNGERNLTDFDLTLFSFESESM